MKDAIVALISISIPSTCAGMMDLYGRYLAEEHGSSDVDGSSDDCALVSVDLDDPVLSAFARPAFSVDSAASGATTVSAALRSQATCAIALTGKELTGEVGSMLERLFEGLADKRVVAPAEGSDREWMRRLQDKGALVITAKRISNQGKSNYKTVYFSAINA